MPLYQTSEHGFLIRVSDGANIPHDPGNRDYQEAMAAIEADPEANEPYVPTLDSSASTGVAEVA